MSTQQASTTYQDANTNIGYVLATLEGESFSLL